MNRPSFTRREFLRLGAVASVALPLAVGLGTGCAGGRLGGRGKAGCEGLLPRRRLGRTGVMVSALGLGGAMWISRTDDKDAVERILNEAIDSGITYFDTAHGYGRSQANLGLVMGTPRRRGLFIAGKVEARDYDGAMRECEESLRELRVDVIDLLQVHHINPGEDVAALGKPGGVIAAMRRLREERVIRFLGVTGHPDYPVVKECLERYDDLDTFMCFINPLARSRPVFEEQLPVARRKDMGIVAMKVYGGGDPAALVGSGPCQATAEELLRFALSENISVAIPAVSSLEQLRENVRVARACELMEQAERERLIARLNT
ncbi:MAG: aldo/keto reductase [bacterium]